MIYDLWLLGLMYQQFLSNFNPQFCIHWKYYSSHSSTIIVSPLALSSANEYLEERSKEVDIPAYGQMVPPIFAAYVPQNRCVAIS